MGSLSQQGAVLCDLAKQNLASTNDDRLLADT